MSSGYLQATLYNGMNGRGGLSAWQSLLIFNGIIGVPTALCSYEAIPNSPSNTQSMVPDRRKGALYGQNEIHWTRSPRKTHNSHNPRRRAYLDGMAILSTVHCSLCRIRIYSSFNVLKLTCRYSVEQVNLIPTAGYEAHVIFTLPYAWLSGDLQMRLPIVIFAEMIALIGIIIFSVWPANNVPTMMAGWIFTFLETGAGALIVAWINEIYTYSAEHRILIIGFVETMTFTFNASVPLLAYNTA